MKYIVVLMFFLLFAGNIQAEKAEAYLIIVGGGKSYADAEKAKAAYLSFEELTSQVGHDIVLIASDTIEGLNPGFYIAYIGVCGEMQKAKLIADFANNYCKGTYIKKFFIDLTRQQIPVPTFKPKEAPFEGNNFSYMPSDYGLNCNDPLSDTFINSVSVYDELIVKNDKPCYSERIGSFDIFYFLAWNKTTKEVFYISELHFSRIPDLINGGDCNISSEEYSMGEMVYTKTTDECIHGLDITSQEISDFESYEYYMHFPSNTFGFREVLMYELSADGNFEYFLQNDYFKNKQTEEHTMYEYSSGVKLFFEGPNEWSNIMVEDGYIEYNTGGGA